MCSLRNGIQQRAEKLFSIKIDGRETILFVVRHEENVVSYGIQNYVCNRNHTVKVKQRKQ